MVNVTLVSHSGAVVTISRPTFHKRVFELERENGQRSLFGNEAIYRETGRDLNGIRERIRTGSAGPRHRQQPGADV